MKKLKVFETAGNSNKQINTGNWDAHRFRMRRERRYKDFDLDIFENWHLIYDFCREFKVEDIKTNWEMSLPFLLNDILGWYLASAFYLPSRNTVVFLMRDYEYSIKNVFNHLRECMQRFKFVNFEVYIATVSYTKGKPHITWLENEHYKSKSTNVPGYVTDVEEFLAMPRFKEKSITTRWEDYYTHVGKRKYKCKLKQIPGDVLRIMEKQFPAKFAKQFVLPKAGPDLNESIELEGNNGGIFRLEDVDMGLIPTFNPRNFE